MTVSTAWWRCLQLTVAEEDLGASHIGEGVLEDAADLVMSRVVPSSPTASESLTIWLM